ncbi:MAG TPA: MFS transporter [Alphaproteobacteria bacterium]|nr:MFS transporter [Alphaproteobacteria bacterium]
MSGITPLPSTYPRLRIALYYSCMFGMVGIFQPFFPIWLADRGLNASEIGLLLAVASVTRATANPLIARFADTREDRKQLVWILCLGGMVTACAMLPAYGFWPVLVLTLVHVAVQAPVNPLGENLILLNLQARGLDYGRLRAWGSAAFIATSMAGGAFLEGRAADWVMYLFIGALGAIFLAALALPKVIAAPARRERPPLRSLLSNGFFVLFLICAALNMASHAVLTGFSSLHWQSAGHSEGMIGFLWAIGVVSEVMLFAWARPILDRIGIPGMLILGAAAGVIRWTGTGASTDLLVLVPMQILHGVTFGATHLGGMTLIQRHIVPGVSASAQALYSSLGMGAAMGLTMAASGWLYEMLEGHAFWVMAGLSAGSLAVAIAVKRQWDEDVQIG